MTLGMVEHRELALKLRDKYGIWHFVETGTYKGDTTKWAAEHFAKVVTIEAYHERYKKTVAGLKAQLKNVKFVYGDSRVELGKALAKIKGPALLWLDAHWCNNYEYSLNTDGECPLIEELKAVRKGDFVLIDDARLFTSPPNRPHDPAQWPKFEQIKQMLGDRFVVIWKDAIIAVPWQAADLVREAIGMQKQPVFVFAASNKYLHCLPATYYLFNKHVGPGYTARLLRYDVRPPKPPANWVQAAVGKQQAWSWSRGLRAFLIWMNPEDKIILMLEDYWISKYEHETVRVLWDLMDKRPEIMKIDLTADRMKTPHEPYERIGEVELVKSTDEALYRGSVQAAIWRTEYLIQHLDYDWNAWQFERHGCNDGALILGTTRPVLEYSNAIGGQGNKPGEFDRRKIPDHLWRELQGKGLV